ncbi:MAG: hypothetical protein HOP06_06845 [Methylotenera sp.]|nr:hypothetical protein [Methylotenera sp.]
MNSIEYDCYAALGLQENPFKIHALGANEVGKRLLVGRDEQVQLVAQRLHKHGKITCLDGHVGVGKTSLVNVATYDCFQAFLHGETTQLLVPLSESFQLAKDDNVNDFCDRVFRKVANGLLAHREQLKSFSFSGTNLEHVNAWLNSPIVELINDTLGGAVNAGVPLVASSTLSSSTTTTKQTNTSAGFSQEGFEQLVRKWLNEIFSVQGNGGVVCVIDNLELLESGAAARRTLEGLRDKLFNVNGLRWVFCGANGVVHSLAASPRLGSFLNTPIIDVQNITQSHIEPLIKTRLKEFAMGTDNMENCLPIRLQDLTTLYIIINSNLRDLLNLADEYCEHHFNIGKLDLTEEQKEKRFKDWLPKVTKDSYRTLSSRIPQDTWLVLDIAMSDNYKGTFGIGDFDSFSSNSKVQITQSTFEKWLRNLVKLGILSKSIEDSSTDDEFNRDVYTVTAKGSLVHYARFIANETKNTATYNWLRRIHY